MKRTEVDIVDVHVTSISERVDAFTQYPLLDGTKKYTVEITEFVCPLAGQDALPSQTNLVDNLLFEIRRKYVSNPATAVNHVHSSLVTPPNLTAQNLAANIYLPYGLFTPDKVEFRKNDQRPMATPGDMVYHMQRFFDDVIRRYMQAKAVALVNLTVQNNIATNLASTVAEITAAQLLIAGTNANNGLQALYDGMEPEIVGTLHGGAPNQPVAADTRFVTVVIQPNGCIKLFLSPIFTKHFFLSVTTYGARLLGLGENNLIALRELADGRVVQGLTALTDNNPIGNIIEGTTAETVEFPGRHPLERYFDHRIRLEIESQIGIPPTVVWSTDDRQKLSHVIATFPIQMTSQSSVVCNSEGAATQEVHYQSDMLVGDITWRRAEDKISERYLVQNSQYFHNVRLEIFVVRKEWYQDEFRFIRNKMKFSEGESWTAKIRFRSIK